jgi:hypothetical protein
MSASDSPVVSEQLLPVRDQQLQREEPSTELVDDKWPSRKTMIFAVLAGLILWTVIILVISRVF